MSIPVIDNPDLSTPQLPPFDLAPEQVPGRMAQKIIDDVARQEALNEKQEQQLASAGEPQDYPLAVVPTLSLWERIGYENLIALKREATDWDPQHLTIPAGHAIQLVGRRPFRVAVFFANPSGALLLSSRKDGFDTSENKYITLNSGAALELDTEGVIWGKNTGGSDVTVELNEVYYEPQRLITAIRLLARDINSGDIKQAI